jgi:hypothetical protein
MRKFKFQPSFIQFLYIVIYLALFGLIFFIPALIRGDIQLSEKMIFREELIEGSLLVFLFILNVILLNLYKNEVSRQKMIISKINDEKKSAQEKLNDSFRYIGQVNVQLLQIKSIFNNYDKFPETKNEFRRTLSYFSDRVFGIINANWVLFRIINCNSHKTVQEHFEARKGCSPDYPHISNKMIIEEQSCSPFSTVISNPQNLNIMVCCILPFEKINNDEQVFIQAITNEITMFFVILNSTYYKNSGELLTENLSRKSIRQHGTVPDLEN